MCGISGVVSKEIINTATLIKMNQTIKHRGPNDEGFVFFDEFLKPTVAGSNDTDKNTWDSNYKYKPTVDIEDVQGKYKLGFGHRRLSIIDLSPAGHMPMCSEDQTLWITYNGEIYNFIEIRDELEVLGYNFITTTDTEVILNAYKEWGENCLNKFMGMFAFAILDISEEKIFLARDRFGIKPFYYWISNAGNFYFASEIKQFTESSEWNPKLNHQRAFDYLYNAKTDHTNETMFSGVFQLEPGHKICVDLCQGNFNSEEPIKTLSWYNPSFKTFKGSFDEATTIFKEKFFQSVKLHLRADVKVGCTLSGGLDSSSITCVVNELLKEEGKVDIQNTFSAIDGDSKYSEKKWIDEVLKEVDVNAHYITPTPDEVLKNIDAIVYQMDEPIGSLSPYLAFLVDRCAKENDITVLLNGQGADEYLGGYGAFRKIQRQKSLDSLNVIKIKKEFDCSSVGALKLAIRSMLRQVYVSIFPKKYNNSFANPLSSKKWFNYLNLDLLIVEKSNIKKTKTTELTYQTISNSQLTKNPLPMFLRWEDRNSMTHSLEARVPFLDHRLVEFCHTLPIEYVDNPNKTKRILLEAMSGIIPEKIYNRKDKMGYMAPEERWVKHEYTQEFKDLLNESINHSKGIIKPEVLDYFDQLALSNEKFNYSYWRFIMFGHWMKVFKVSVN